VVVVISIFILGGFTYIVDTVFFWLVMHIT